MIRGLPCWAPSGYWKLDLKPASAAVGCSARVRLCESLEGNQEDENSRNGKPLNHSTEPERLEKPIQSGI